MMIESRILSRHSGKAQPQGITYSSPPWTFGGLVTFAPVMEVLSARKTPNSSDPPVAYVHGNIAAKQASTWIRSRVFIVRAIMQWMASQWRTNDCFREKMNRPFDAPRTIASPSKAVAFQIVQIFLPPEI